VKKKRILFVIDSLNSGGAQNQITLVASALKRKNYDVTLFYYFESSFFLERLIHNGVNTIFKKKKDKLGITVINDLRNILPQYDVAISYLDTPNFYLCIAKYLSSSNVRIITSKRSSSNLKSFNYLKLRLVEWVNKLSDRIISNSFHERETWTNSYTYLTEKFSTIYNLVDKQSVKLKSDFSTTKNILVVGKLRPLKNAEVLIDALLKLNDKNISVTWIGHVSSKNKKLNSYHDKIFGLIDKHNLSGQWTFKSPIQEMGACYQHYDLLIHPSLLEGLPNVVCEAMTAGLPVLISNILDHPKMIGDREDYLFDPHNSEELAQKIQSFLNLSLKEMRSHSKYLLKRAEALFGESSIITQYEELIL